jgi:thiol-disulfide isomerase/thioredoxin
MAQRFTRQCAQPAIALIAGLLCAFSPVRADGQEVPAPAPPAADERTDGSAPSGPITVVTGQLVDLLGRGVQDARVEVLPKEGAPGPALAEGVTDEIGDFRIEWPGTHRGDFVLRFTKDGFTTTEHPFTVEEDDPEPFVDAVLRGALRVQGEVVDAVELQPVRGAAVSLRTIYSTLRAVSGEDGRFSFEQLMGGQARLTVEAEGLGTAVRNVTIAPLKDETGTGPAAASGAGIDGQALYRVALLPERVVHVTILNDQNQPVAGAGVEIRLDAFYSAQNTGAAGEATFRGLPGDKLRLPVRVTHRDYLSSGAYDREITLAEKPLEARHTLTVTPGAVVSGRVLEQSSRQPVNGARVSIGTSILDGLPHTFTSLDGQFEIPGLPPGPAVITVHASDHAPELIEVTTAARQVSRVEVSVGTGRTVSGTIRGPDGQPAAEAEVLALAWRGHRTLGLSALADQAGRFTIEHAPPDEFQLDLSAPGAALLGQPITADRHDYAFELEKISAPATGGPALAGPRAGDPCPGFTVTALDGRRWSMQDLAGKWVLLDFWATWCGPCVQELPVLKRIHARHGARPDFVMIGISRDFDKAALTRLVDNQKLGWPQVQGTGSGGDELCEAVGLLGIPWTLLVGPDGSVIAAGLSGGALEDQVNNALSATTGD